MSSHKVLLGVSEGDAAMLAAAATAVGATVISAADRTAVVHSVRTDEPSVVVLDLSPTSKTGGAALGPVIRQENPHVRLIFVGGADERNTIEGLLGGDMFLPRPLDAKLAEFALKTLLIKYDLAQTGRYKRLRNFNPKAVESAAMQVVARRLASARTVGQVAELVKGFVSDILPFTLFVLSPAPMQGELLPRCYVRGRVSSAQFELAKEKVRELAESVFGALPPDGFRPTLYGSLTVAERKEHDTPLNPIHWVMSLPTTDATGNETPGAPVGFVMLFRPEPFDMPHAVNELCQSGLSFGALALSRQLELAHEKLALLSAVMDSAPNPMLWIEPRSPQVMLNREARQAFGLPETGVVGKDEFLQKLRDVGAYDGFFGPEAQKKNLILKSVTLEKSAKPQHVELVRVNDDNRMVLGSFMMVRDRGADGPTQELALLSHEAKVPLNAIVGYADLLLEGVEGKLTPRQRTCVQHMVDATKKLNELVDFFTAVARGGMQHVVKRPVDSTGLFESVLADFQVAADKAHVQLSQSVVEPAATLMIDENQFRIVLNNLLSNALKYTGSGGQIALKAKSADIVTMARAFSRPDDQVPLAPTDPRAGRSTTRLVRRSFVHVSCSDTGSGIKPEHLERVFDPTVRIPDSSPAFHQAGAGLGLPITRKIVEAHGGRIWAESDGVPGRGSVFHIVLPAGFDVSAATTSGSTGPTASGTPSGPKG